MEEKDANNIFNIRQEMNKVFLKKLKTPKLPLNEAEEILDAVAIQSSKLKPNPLYYEHLFLYYVIIDIMKLFTFFKKSLLCL